MFDPSVETPITLKQAAKLPMVRKNGKPLHIATLFRWSTGGCRGVRLETIQIGGSRCTSEEAMLRFIRALSQSNPAPLPASSAKRKQDLIDKRELDEVGI